MKALGDVMVVTNALGQALQLLLSNIQLSDLTQNLKLGDVVRARVIDILPGQKAIVQLRGNNLVADLKGPVSQGLSKNDVLQLAVQELPANPSSAPTHSASSSLTLQLLDIVKPGNENLAVPKTAPFPSPVALNGDNSLENLLEQIKVPVSQANLQIAKIFQSQGMPVTASAIQQVWQKADQLLQGLSTAPNRNSLENTGLDKSFYQSLKSTLQLMDAANPPVQQHLQIQESLRLIDRILDASPAPSQVVYEGENTTPESLPAAISIESNAPSTPPSNSNVSLQSPVFAPLNASQQQISGVLSQPDQVQSLPVIFNALRTVLDLVEQAPMAKTAPVLADAPVANSGLSGISASSQATLFRAVRSGITQAISQSLNPSPSQPVSVQKIQVTIETMLQELNVGVSPLGEQLAEIAAQVQHDSLPVPAPKISFGADGLELPEPPQNKTMVEASISVPATVSENEGQAQAQIQPSNELLSAPSLLTESNSSAALTLAKQILTELSQELGQSNASLNFSDKGSLSEFVDGKMVSMKVNISAPPREAIAEALAFLQTKSVPQKISWVETVANSFSQPAESFVSQAKQVLTLSQALPATVLSQNPKLEQALQSFQEAFQGLAVNPETASLDSGALSLQLENFVQQSGVNFEAKLAQEAQATVKPAAAQAGGHDLKALLLNVEHEVKSALAHPGSDSAYSQVVLTGLAKQVKNTLSSLTALQFSNLPSGSKESFSLHIPVWLGREIMPGQLSIYWRQGKQPKLSEKEPLSMVFQIKTRALGQVRVSLLLWSRDCQCRVEVEDEGSKAFISKHLDDLKSAFNSRTPFELKDVQLGLSKPSSLPNFVADSLPVLPQQRLNLSV